MTTMKRAQSRIDSTVFSIAVAVLIGCSHIGEPTETAELHVADSLVLYSLDPDDEYEGADPTFHEYRILGDTTVTDRATRLRIADALQKGIDEHNGLVASCFDPRHGIRVQHSGSTIDFLICFECLQVERFKDGQPIGGFLISNSPQQVLDDVLRKAGVPLAERPHSN